MKIFLSALENGNPLASSCWLAKIDKMPFRMKWNLMSYYYLRSNEKRARGDFIRDHSEEVLIDSGAHSFQKGARVPWEEYTRQYAAFIHEFDRPHVLGYFEMDVDVVLGHERVKGLRRILEQASTKIIPVWHKNRGIAEFDAMCREYAGKIIAITGFANEDIQDTQYLMFLRHAKKFGCRVHCLGMARQKVLDAVPFDYTDSASWRHAFLHARAKFTHGTRKVVSSWFSDANNRDTLELWNYRWGMAMQKKYYEKWRHMHM